jgi:hypothetical protein
MSRAVFAAVALAVALAALPSPGRGQCSTTDLAIAAMNEDLSTVEGILRVADKFEEMARREPECAGGYFAAFRTYYTQARQRYAQSIGLARRRWPLQAGEREKERGPVAAEAARAGWALVDDARPYRLEEDPEWSLGRFGALLPPVWGGYLRQAAAEERVRADALAGGGNVPALTLEGWLSFWEGFAARYPAGFELSGDVQARIARLRKELGR